MALDSGDYHGSLTRNVSVGSLDETSASAGSIGERTILHQSVEIAMQRKWTHYYHGSRARLRGIRHVPIRRDNLWPSLSSLAGPTVDIGESGSSKGHSKGISTRETTFPRSQETVYRNVCTDREPPCSVAINPAKRCVAFGSQGGIELYWVRFSTRHPTPVDAWEMLMGMPHCPP